MIKGIAFDLYDTLIHLENEEYNARQTLFANEIGAPADTVKSIWKKHIQSRMRGDIVTLRDMIKVLLDELEVKYNEAFLSKLEQMQVETLMETIRFYPDVDKLLETLKQKGFIVSLLSNTSHNSENVLEIIPWKHYFDYMILSHKIGIIKPDPRIYLIASGAMGILPEECLFVGDGGSMELDGASSVGMITAKVVQEGQSKSFVRSETADYIIDSVHRIPELVDSINNTH